MKTGTLKKGTSLHTALVSCLVAVLALLPSGLLTAAQGGPGMVTEIGGTVSCVGGWTLMPEDSSPTLVMHASPDGSASFYLQHAPYTDAPTAVVTSLLDILGGTVTQIVDNGGVAYAGSTGDGRVNLVYHERTADGSSGYSLLILAKTGTLGSHLQTIQQNCVLDGVPLMNGQDVNALASIIPGEGGATAPSGGCRRTRPQLRPRRPARVNHLVVARRPSRWREATALRTGHRLPGATTGPRRWT